MSENYNKEQNSITIFDVIMLCVAVLVAMPILPFCILYIFLVVKTNKKENHIIYACIAVIAIMFIKIEVFFEQMAVVTSTIIKSVLNGAFDITAYRQYSFSSWILLVALSFVIASYAVKRIRYNYKLEEAGVISLQR